MGISRKGIYLFDLRINKPDKISMQFEYKKDPKFTTIGTTSLVIIS